MLLAIVVVLLAWVGYAWYTGIAITQGIEERDMDWNGDGQVTRERDLAVVLRGRRQPHPERPRASAARSTGAAPARRSAWIAARPSRLRRRRRSNGVGQGAA